MLSVTERAVYGASMSAVPQLWLNSKIVGLLTLKRPEGRAPTNRQLVDALLKMAVPFRIWLESPGARRQIPRVHEIGVRVVRGMGCPQRSSKPASRRIPGNRNEPSTRPGRQPA